VERVEKHLQAPEVFQMAWEGNGPISTRAAVGRHAVAVLIHPASRLRRVPREAVFMHWGAVRIRRIELQTSSAEREPPPAFTGRDHIEPVCVEYEVGVDIPGLVIVGQLHLDMTNGASHLLERFMPHEPLAGIREERQRGLEIPSRTGAQR
jgi:hypothetical protein